MKFLFDLFPVILFVIAFYTYDIFVATGVAIGATFVQVGWSWLRHRRVDNMMWISLAVIVLFGGATIAFQDETFIKWKPTVLYWLFAVVLWGASLLLGKNLIRAMLDNQITLPEIVWYRLNLSWIAFFIFMGCINLYIAYTFSLEFWVNFKLFGSTGLMLLFVIAQVAVIGKHLNAVEAVASDRHTEDNQTPRNDGVENSKDKD